MRIRFIVAAASIACTTPAAAVAGPADDAPATVADHVAIQVADLDASVAFYRGAFGFAEIATAVPGRRWLDLGGGMQLHIHGGRKGPVTSPRPVHLALSTRSLDPVMAYLRWHGVSWQDAAGNVGAVSQVRIDGVRQIFFQDPDGYWLEVNDALKPR